MADTKPPFCVSTTEDTFYFETLEAAIGFQAMNGGAIGQLSATGKTYGKVKASGTK